LIAGALDTKFVALAAAMEAALPRARVAVVPDAGHAVHLERPREFTRLVTAFLDEGR
jgi:pimeloyl-ACP methyl ester carboxylesterase